MYYYENNVQGEDAGAGLNLSIRISISVTSSPLSFKVLTILFSLALTTSLSPTTCLLSHSCFGIEASMQAQVLIVIIITILSIIIIVH